MKKIITILAICTIAVAACKKKTSPPTSTPVTSTLNGSMTAVINGVSWTSTRNTGVLVIEEDDDLSALVLNGETSADVIALGIDFPTASNILKVDNHDFGMSKDDAVFSYVRKTSGGGTITEHFPEVGTINITSVDNVNKKVSGTFDCVFYKVGSSAAADSIYITNGVFTNIGYAIQ